jgi:hypothetical protein
MLALHAPIKERYLLQQGSSYHHLCTTNQDQIEEDHQHKQVNYLALLPDDLITFTPNSIIHIREATSSTETESLGFQINLISTKHILDSWRDRRRASASLEFQGQVAQQHPGGPDQARCMHRPRPGPAQPSPAQRLIADNGGRRGRHKISAPAAVC